MAVGPETWVAAYAAIVATGALALEIRRWVESGPKINVRVMQNMTLLDGDGSERAGLTVVNATNRGDAPTTITHFGILEFPTLYARLRRKHRNSFVVIKPELPGSGFGLPYHLETGKQWFGMVDDSSDATNQFHSGKYWAAIYATDRERPYLVRIPRPSAPMELIDASKI